MLVVSEEDAKELENIVGGTQVLIDYVDPVKATIAILKDWRDQEWKATNGRDQIEEIYTRLTSTTSHLGSTPVTGGGGNKVESAMTEGIHQKEIAEHGYLKAREYMGEISPCWERLTEDERYMLMVRFIDHAEGDGIARIMSRYCVSRTEAYRKSDAALRRLSKLMFW